MSTSSASESYCRALELDDIFEEFHGVGEEGGDCACDERDGGGLEIVGLPVAFVGECEVIHE